MTDNTSPTTEVENLPTELPSNAVMTDDQVDAFFANYDNPVPAEAATEAQEDVKEAQHSDEEVEQEELDDSPEVLEEDEDEVEIEAEEDSDTDQESEHYNLSEQLDKTDDITIGGVTKTLAQWEALSGQDKATSKKARQVAEEVKAATAAREEAEKYREAMKVASEHSHELSTLSAQFQENQKKIEAAEAEGDMYNVFVLEREQKAIANKYQQAQASVQGAKIAEMQQKAAVAVAALEERGLGFLTKDGTKESQAWVNHAKNKLKLDDETFMLVAHNPDLAEAVWNDYKVRGAGKAQAKRVQSTKTSLTPSGKKSKTTKQKGEVARKERFASGTATEADVDAEIRRIAGG